jgi:hypothetical protein
MSDTGDHARRELTLIGETPAVIDLLVQLVEVFVTWNTIAPKAVVTPMQTIQMLLDNKPLTPLTNDPAEWQVVGQRQLFAGNMNVWRSIRDPKAYSTDGGKTYWLDDGTGKAPTLPMFTTHNPP